MSGLFAPKIATQTPNALSGVSFQSATQGKPIPIVYGRNRVSGNVIWYGDFLAKPISTSSGGGKGGGSQSSVTGYNYQTGVAMGLCEGPISGIGIVWSGSTISNMAQQVLTEFDGTNPQAAWSYLTTNHPDQALNYPNLAYAASGSYQLWNSNALPNLSFETNGFKPVITHSSPGTLDPSAHSAHLTLSNGNLTTTTDGTAVYQNAAGLYASSGKLYCEVVFFMNTGMWSARHVGIGDSTTSIADGQVVGQNSGYAYDHYTGDKFHNNSSVAYGATWDGGDVIGMYWDVGAGTLGFTKNGVDQGIAYTGIPVGSYRFIATGYGNISGTVGANFTVNFGESAFAYSPPAGFTGWLNSAIPPTPSSYATLDPSQANYRIVLSGGNLVASMPATVSNNWGIVKANIYSTPGSGQYYCEMTCQSPYQASVLLGLATSSEQTADGYYCGIDGEGISYSGGNGDWYTSNIATSGGAGFTTGCVVGMLFDAAAQTVEIRIGGVHQATFTMTGTTGLAWTPCVSLGCTSGTTSVTMNFGATAWAHAPGGSYTGWYGVPATPDVTPAAVMYDLLTNTTYGALWPSAQLDSLADWDAYCTAMGFLISPAFESQTVASSIIKELAQIGNAEPVWSQGILKVVPYADAAVGSYTPNTTVNYALTDDDFIGKPGEDPIKITRKRQADAFNSISVTGKDRGNSYNSCTYTAQDQALLDQFGVLQAQTYTFDEICTIPVLQLVAQTILQRQAYFRNLYEFTVGWGYARLEPMDLVSLTDAGLGLNAYSVRILSITEDADGNLAIQAEDFFGGVTNPSTNGAQPGGGSTINTGVAPATTGTPTIVQPLISYTGTPQIFVGAAQAPGGGSGTWGGCQVWISTDNITYTQVGTITSPATFGVTSGSIAYEADPDSTSTLGVDLTASTGVMASVPQSSADALISLAYLDNYIGELIAYETATLTSASKYNLTYLRRGAYQTLDEAHATAAVFMLLNGAPLAIACPSSYVGQTVYVKLPAISATGGAVQSLASVSPTTYVVQRIGMVISGGVIPATIPAYNYLLAPGGQTLTVPANELVCNGEILALGELAVS